MPKQKYYSEPELAMVVKEIRIKSGKRKDVMAQELGVGRPSVQLAEGTPSQSLTKLRIRIIEQYSKFRVVGPLYRLEKRKE